MQQQVAQSVGLPLTRTQIANQQLQAGNMNYVEMNAVPWNGFSLYEPGNTNHELLITVDG
jgi:hypothetical protein